MILAPNWVSALNNAAMKRFQELENSRSVFCLRQLTAGGWRTAGGVIPRVIMFAHQCICCSHIVLYFFSAYTFDFHFSAGWPHVYATLLEFLCGCSSFSDPCVSARAFFFFGSTIELAQPPLLNRLRATCSGASSACAASFWCLRRSVQQQE